MSKGIWIPLLLLVGGASFFSAPGVAAVTVRNGVAIYTPSARESQQAGPVDFVNARPMELPRTYASTAPSYRDGMVEALLTPSRTTGSATSGAAPRVVPGAQGDGKTSPVFLGRPKVTSADLRADLEVTTQESGTLNHPFSTARADAYQGSTHTQFPYRASGKLFFKVGTETNVCTASLIRRGIIVTAAHCVAPFGRGFFYKNFRFVPGYKNGHAPFGVWWGTRAAVLNSWRNGTDRCSDAGVVCTNDVAVIRLAAKNGKFAGQHTGFYSYGVNGFGFVAGTTHVTQIGYPVCLDNGNLMERNDSQGFVHWPSSGNTIIGSLMCGGSSGGPWLLNFGRRPKLTGTSNGTAFAANTVIGVTSWGYVGGGPKQQGASRFTGANIGKLATMLCGGSPNPC
ncbi:MAG TPA: trypsin-like serine protease [Pseudomonadales bacterium]